MHLASRGIPEELRQWKVAGRVQGVGFRPFVYTLAKRLELNGWVRNTSAGVDIEADGPPEVLSSFEQALLDEAPPLARIDQIAVTARAADGFSSFEINRHFLNPKLLAYLCE